MFIQIFTVENNQKFSHFPFLKNHDYSISKSGNASCEASWVKILNDDELRF